MLRLRLAAVIALSAVAAAAACSPFGGADLTRPTPEAGADAPSGLPPDSATQLPGASDRFCNRIDAAFCDDFDVGPIAGWTGNMVHGTTTLVPTDAGSPPMAMR